MFGHDDDDDDDELASPSEDLLGHGVGYIRYLRYLMLVD